MNHLIVLHNGDPNNGSPHWMVKIWEDGQIRGEILTKQIRRLPEDFKLDNPSSFFKIPPPLAHKKLNASPHCEEIIIYLATPSGEWLCSFVLSEVPTGSDLCGAVQELVTKISGLASQTGPNTS